MMSIIMQGENIFTDTSYSFDNNISLYCHHLYFKNLLFLLVIILNYVRKSSRYVISVCLVFLVYLVCLVNLVYLVFLSSVCGLRSTVYSFFCSSLYAQRHSPYAFCSSLSPYFLVPSSYFLLSFTIYGLPSSLLAFRSFLTS